MNVGFKTDPSGKEFDLITPDLIVEGKNFGTTNHLTLTSENAASYRMQFEAAINTSRKTIVDIKGDITSDYATVFEEFVAMHPSVKYRLINNGTIISSNF